MVISFKGQAATSATSYDYDVANGVVMKTDPNGRRMKYEYDTMNNLSRLSLLDAPTQVYDYYYDATNQLAKMTYPGGEQTFTYDDLDRLASIKDSVLSTPLTVSFKYDHQDRITWITYPDKSEVCYEYDPDGRITRVGRVAAGQSASFCSSGTVAKVDYKYDTKGRLSKVVFPNAVESFVEYFADTGLVRTAGHRKVTGELIYSDSYDYFSDTNLYRTITHTTLTGTKRKHYTYDAHERLETVQEGDTGRATTFQYDAFGNRLAEIITCGTSNIAGQKLCGTYTYTYSNASNRLVSMSFNGQLSEQFHYDNAGRMIRRDRFINGVAQTTGYSFDDRGLLTQVTKADGTVIKFTYDALGARKSKTVITGAKSETLYYITAPLFGLSHVLMEMTSATAVKAAYTYGGGQQLMTEAAGTREYLLHEGTVGSITHALDTAGAVRNSYDHDAFGAPLNNSAGPYGYTGEEYDAETGLLYLRARYYDPTLGRFISADPYWGRLEEPVTQNRFIYVQNNPLLFVDPSGNVVYLTGHELLPGTGVSHSALLIIPDAVTPGSLTDGTWRIGEVGLAGNASGVASGLPYRTISAGPTFAGFGNLESTPFRRTDHPGVNGVYDVVLPPPGMSNADFEASLITADASYRNNAPYDFVRAFAGVSPLESQGWNSNSYISGLAGATGGRMAGNYGSVVFPLMENPLPSSYFRFAGCPAQ